MNNQKGIIPPQAPELEEAVLGAMLVEKESISEAIEVIKSPQFFYSEKNSTIFKAITDLFADGEAIDLLTVTKHLRSKGKIDSAGGSSYIADLTSRVNSSAHIQQHCRIVTEMYLRRESIKRLSEMVSKSYDEQNDVFDLIDNIEQSISDLRGQITTASYSSMMEASQKYFKELQERIDLTDKGEFHGVPSGIIDLDKVTGGWRQPDLIIIAARPGMGKTALTLSILRNAVVQFKKAAAIFSLEMNKSQLVERLISAESMVNHSKLKKGELNSLDMSHIMNRTSELVSSKLFIDDTPGITLLELKAKARKLKKTEGIELLAVDYLQLMKGNKEHKGNREQEISSISRGLKELAKELEIPIIALSQLSRAVEQRGGDKRPQLSDLRESGSIEQDADMVAFIYRPEYYGITEDEHGQSMVGLGEFIIAKNRSGALETVLMKFIGKFIKYTDVNDNDQSYDPKQQAVESVEYTKFTPADNEFENESKVKDDKAPF